MPRLQGITKVVFLEGNGTPIPENACQVGDKVVSASYVIKLTPKDDNILCTYIDGQNIIFKRNKNALLESELFFGP